MVDVATSDDASPDAGPDRRWTWVLHLFIVATGGGVLWSVSYPGSNVSLFAVSGCASVAAGCCWLGWTVFVAGRTGGWQRWFPIGPVIGVLALVLLCTGAPFKMRWAAGRNAFAALVAGHSLPPPGSPWERLSVPHRLGLYTIKDAGWVPGGAIFSETHGDVFYDASFAYLPSGPTRDVETAMGQSANFHHIGGDWYRWSATS